MAVEDAEFEPRRSEKVTVGDQRASASPVNPARKMPAVNGASGLSN